MFATVACEPDDTFNCWMLFRSGLTPHARPAHHAMIVQLLAWRDSEWTKKSAPFREG
jgi:hypothetical protein